MAEPNFFLLGAGRCGTTTVWQMLREHPDIFMTSDKEPCHFSPSFQIVADPDQYTALYDPATTEQARGEASHTYMTDPGSARLLYQRFPTARFIVILRHPADRAHALYQWTTTHGYEPLPTFELALKAETRRWGSARFRARCPQYLWNYLYFRSGLYGEQLQRYFDLYPASHFHVLELSELQTDTDNALGQIHNFLGVKPQPGPLAHLSNSSGVRAPAVRSAVRRLRSSRWNERVPHAARFGDALWNATQTDHRSTFRPATKLDLARRFEPDLRLLRELTGTDLVLDE